MNEKIKTIANIFANQFIYRKYRQFFIVDLKKLIQELSLSNFPIGLGGCKNHDYSFDCCEYNVTVFDGKDEPDYIFDHDENIIKIHHGSFSTKNSDTLIQFDNMHVIHDEKWDLRMFLSKISKNKEKIFQDFVKDSLINASICATKTKDGLKNNDPFFSCWQKCSAFFLGDAILAINSKRPSPTHSLEFARNIEKNRINEIFSIINDCIGIERATVSQLSRMSKSTMGFSDMIENNNHSKLIQNKHNFLVKNSLLADCYYYLGYVNKTNFLKIKNSIHKKPELIHVLKTAFDLDNDESKIEKQATLLHKTSNNLISTLKKHLYS